jgi:hypothetical protein
VFGPNGETVTEEIDEKTAYRDQVSYLNSRFIPLLEKIISDSSTPPIIIIQGDHGYRTAGEQRGDPERLLPAGEESVLYDTITPVNSFRLITNYYFGASYEELDNISYFSDYKNPFSTKFLE